jgi:hypothetical protein
MKMGLVERHHENAQSRQLTTFFWITKGEPVKHLIPEW